jgi:hypothetical protein
MIAMSEQKLSDRALQERIAWLLGMISDQIELFRLEGDEEANPVEVERVRDLVEKKRWEFKENP